MACGVCGAPVTFDDNGEVACSSDPSHDLDGSTLHDDEMPSGPSDDEQNYDEDNPATWDPATMPWQIASDGEAEWALAKVQRARFELGQIGLRYDDEKRRIDSWREQVSKGPLRDEEFFAGHLARYYERVKDEGRLYGKSKTYRLVNGDIVGRSGSESVEVDEAVFVDWAEANERLDLVEHKPHPKKTAIKAAIKAGETIPGARIVVGDEKVEAKPRGGEPPAWMPMPNTERGDSFTGESAA